MKRIVAICVLLFSFTIAVDGQNDSLAKKRALREQQEEKDWKERIYWGGTIGAWFGSVTFIDLSPIVGYRVTERLSVGVGAIYNYYKYNYPGYYYSTTLYGGRIYGRFFLLDNVYLQAGWDRINRDNPYAFNPNERVWVDNFLVGGGLRYPIGNKVFMTATGLWNLNQTPLSPYYNPIIQIGVVGGF